MNVLGLTGGIGSGKSAASDWFERQGIAVVDADIVAREVVAPGEPALDDIFNHFGPASRLDDGSLNRAYLRQKIFSDAQEKQWLEALLHPIIRTRILSKLEGATTPYAILVSPLLIETDQKLLCDRILLIDVPTSLQITRTIQRDSSSQAQVEAIIASQASREFKRSHADDIIVNDSDLAALYDQLAVYHRKYLTTGIKRL
ncbi:MAG: dephospho-CoA kinase [Hahellaceae bacterium]|nr:dephospho-CoA kinase [Hahellaceae bacterium]MCP5169081.1 dephospho-CoA kinase [Hahellaceae bacterium]